MLINFIFITSIHFTFLIKFAFSAIIPMATLPVDVELVNNRI